MEREAAAASRYLAKVHECSHFSMRSDAMKAADRDADGDDVTGCSS